MKILLLERIHAVAARALKSEGWTVTTESKALGQPELKKAIRRVNALGIRSKSRVTGAVLDQADALECVTCFCIGYDQVDIDTCTDRGIAVFNSPYSNTRSVSELVIGHIIMLLRDIIGANANMHQGLWRKSAANANEVRGKTLGVVGYGHIGSQVSILAEALGMEVIFYDIREALAIGNARRTRSLRELLGASDVVTLHVPDTDSTRGMIGASELRSMKKGALLINTSRGRVVRLEALKEALLKKHLRGAALDVFPKEPGANGPGWTCALRGLPNVILTPHIAGNTKEAQREIGSSAAGKLRKFLSLGTTTGSINFPQLELPPLGGRHRLIHIHKNVPGVISAIGHVLSGHKINIEGQRLGTTEKLGYLVTDVDHTVRGELLKDLNAVENTIRVRALY
ncbi:MAG: phosphoglycerate dehydrogenase [Candidatus Zixiibacteriota bacterium]